MSWGINLLCEAWEPGPSPLSSWHGGGPGCQRRGADGTESPSAQCAQGPGQTPAMWLAWLSVSFPLALLSRMLMILMSWGVGAHSWPLVLVPPCLGIAWPDWKNETSNFVQVGRSFKNESLTTKHGFLRLGSRLAFVNSPIEGMRENENKITHQVNSVIMLSLSAPVAYYIR